MCIHRYNVHEQVNMSVDFQHGDDSVKDDCDLQSRLDEMTQQVKTLQEEVNSKTTQINRQEEQLSELTLKLSENMQILSQREKEEVLIDRMVEMERTLFEKKLEMTRQKDCHQTESNLLKVNLQSVMEEKKLSDQSQEMSVLESESELLKEVIQGGDEHRICASEDMKDLQQRFDELKEDKKLLSNVVEITRSKDEEEDYFAKYRCIMDLANLKEGKEKREQDVAKMILCKMNQLAVDLNVQQQLDNSAMEKQHNACKQACSDPCQMDLANLKESIEKNAQDFEKMILCKMNQLAVDLNEQQQLDNSGMEKQHNARQQAGINPTSEEFLAQCQEVHNQRTAEKSLHTQELNDLEKMNEDLGKENCCLKEELLSVKLSQAEQQNLLDAKCKECENLEVHTQGLADLEKMNEGLKKEICRLREELLSFKLSQAEQQNLLDAKCKECEHMKVHTQEFADLEKMNEGLKKKICRLCAERLSFKLSQAEQQKLLDAKCKECEDLRVSNEVLKDNIKRLTNELNRMQEKLLEIKQKIQEYLWQVQEELEKTRLQAKKQKEELFGVKDELEKTRLQVKKLEEELSEIQEEKILQAKKQEEELAGVQAELDKTRLQAKKLEEELAGVQAELDKTRLQAKKLEGELAKIQEENRLEANEQDEELARIQNYLERIILQATAHDEILAGLREELKIKNQMLLFNDVLTRKLMQLEQEKEVRMQKDMSEMQSRHVAQIDQMKMTLLVREKLFDDMKKLIDERDQQVKEISSQLEVQNHENTLHATSQQEQQQVMTVKHDPLSQSQGSLGPQKVSYVESTKVSEQQVQEVGMSLQGQDQKQCMQQEFAAQAQDIKLQYQEVMKQREEIEEQMQEVRLFLQRQGKSSLGRPSASS